MGIGVNYVLFLGEYSFIQHTGPERRAEWADIAATHYSRGQPACTQSHDQILFIVRLTAFGHVHIRSGLSRYYSLLLL